MIKRIWILLIIVAISFTIIYAAGKYWIGNNPSAEVTSAECVAIAELADAIDGITTVGANTMYNIGNYKVHSAGNETILAANSGKVHLLASITANDTLTLPTPAAGLKYQFVYVGGAAEAQNFQITTTSNTYYFIGGVMFQDLNAGAGSDELSELYSDGNSNSKFTIITPAAGTVINLFSNGTNWYIYGHVLSNTVPTFADQ